MPVKTMRTARKSTGNNREDLHVRIGEASHTAETVPGEGGRYVYGIVQTKDHMNFGKIGIGGAGEPVYTVNYLDIAAVVSKTPVAIFDPTRENALAHEHVIETVMKNHTIIPMSFGTVFRTDDDIREVHAQGVGAQLGKGGGQPLAVRRDPRVDRHAALPVHDHAGAVEPRPA